MPPDAPLSPTPAPTTPVAPVAPVAPLPAARGGGGGRWVNLLLGAAAVLAIGGVAFAIGRSTAPATANAFTPPGLTVDGGPTGSFDPGAMPGGGPGAGGPAFLGAGGPTLEGTVTAIDADSMTIRLASGDEMTIALDAGTTYHESTETDAGAVRVGDEVAVQADGGRFMIGGNGDGGVDPGQGGQPGGDAGRDLTAGDVTVRR